VYFGSKETNETNSFVITLKAERYFKLIEKNLQMAFGRTVPTKSMKTLGHLLKDRLECCPHLIAQLGRIRSRINDRNVHAFSKKLLLGLNDDFRFR
jgi:hypothetical protein